MSPIPSNRTICFLLLPHVHLLDLAGPVQVFYEASQLGATQYKLVYAGFGNDVQSEQGLQLAALPSFNDVTLKPGDFLFVPGIDFKKFANGELSKAVRGIRPWLHRQLQKGVSVASICSGSLILAEAGLLDGKKCTSHWKCIDYMQTHYPHVQVLTDQLYVNDNRVYTSAGMTSGIDMALALLEELHGPVLPAKVAREMVVFLRRNHSDSQQTIYLDYQTHFNPVIHRVQDYIISHPDKNASLEELAALGNMSVRNLTRLFKKTTGHTLVEFKNSVKVELARTLLHNASYTTEKIAGLCGFQSARQLRRVWRQRTGTALKSTAPALNS